MPKRRIELNIWHVVSFIFFVIGMLFMIYGFNACYKMHAAANISRIKTEKLHKGQYVKGEIKKYIGKSIEYSEEFYGVSGSYAYGLTFYDAYTIPTSDDKYIVVYIKDSELQNILENYDEGIGSNAYIVGKVEKPFYSFNYEFWNGTDIFKNEEEAKEKIFSKFIIREINYDKRIHRMYEGLLILFTSWIIFKIGGRVKIK